MFKKLLVVTVAVATIATLGVGFVAPEVAKAVSTGSLVKGPNSQAVYYIGANNKKYVFPDSKTYFSWYKNFNNVQLLTVAELDTYADGGMVLYRPGTKLIKHPNTAKTYVVETGGTIRWVTTEAAAAGLFGANWNQRINDISEVFFPNYKVGTDLSSATDLPNGSLVKASDGTTTYLISGGKKRPFASMDALTANGYDAANTLTVAAATLNGYADGTSITGAESSLMDVSQGGVSTTPAVTTSVTVALAAHSPASSTVVAGQAIADLAHFTFTNNGTDAAKIVKLIVKKTGVSADTTLPSIYLYDGMTRLTDAASVSSGNITFNDANGLFTLAAGASKTVAVKANIAASTSGQTVGVAINSAADVTTDNSGDTIGGTYPLTGATHSVASASMATVDFNTTTSPATTTINPQNEYTVWQNTITIGTRKVKMYSLQLRQIGSVNTADLANFKFYVAGVQKGTTITSLDANGYVTFDLSAAPLDLETGSRELKVVADVVGGSNRNFSFSMRQAGDAYFVDTEFNQPVLPTAASSTFSARTTGTITIDTGTLTFTKKADSPSGTVVNTASNQVLARYEVKAAGESMKVESLRVRIDDDDADDIELRNGALYLDGVQVGSTAAISGDTGTDPDYTEFTFGSSFIVVPGTTRVLEVRADIYDSLSTNDIAANDTLQVELGAGTSNVQRMTSLGYGTYPSTYAEANTLTVGTGTLTASLDTSYTNHNIVAPKYGYKIGSYKISSNSTEGATITSVVIDYDEVADAFDASDDITNMYIKMGTYTSPVKSTIADTANTYSTNFNVAANQTITLEIWGDIASTATDGDGTADTAESSVTVSYTTGVSATSTSAAEVDGQTITATTGTFVAALDGATPLNRIVAGNQEVEAAKFKWTATNETYTIKEVQIAISSATVASAINEVRLYDGTTLLGSAPVAQETNTAALITGLNVGVTANQTKTLSVRYMLNPIGSNAGTSQVNAVATLDLVKYQDSQGVETSDDTPGASDTEPAGNEMYVYKSVPTVERVSLTPATLVNGAALDIYKFIVRASAGGDLALKQFILTAAWSDGGTADTLELESVKLFEDGTDVTASVVIQDEDGNSVESTSGLLEGDEDLTISWATGYESVIPAGGYKTYTVRATPQGFRMTGADTSGDSVSLYLAGDTAHNSTKLYLNGTATAATLWGLHTAAAVTGSGTLYEFIWSDMNLISHATTENATSSADWANGYKVMNLDLEGQTWTK